jgi:hypothetical protein
MSVRRVYLHRISVPSAVAARGLPHTPDDVIDELVMAFFLHSDNSLWSVAEPVRNRRDNLHFFCPERRTLFFGIPLWARRSTHAQLDVAIQRLHRSVTIDVRHSIGGKQRDNVTCKSAEDPAHSIEKELMEFCRFLQECCQLDNPPRCVRMRSLEL